MVKASAAVLVPALVRKTEEDWPLSGLGVALGIPWV